ncbi:MAG: DEAD/DEAH box helicase [Balneola sp.]|nr:MAG: DEAD/DEAH box helicase [Balneola sp.]
MKFTDLDLHENLQNGLGDIGYSEPTPVQEKSIPIILTGKDVIGAAQTGTGKTGAFVIPIIQHIVSKAKDGTNALILSPTRELAQQIDEQIFALGYHCGISSATIIGGEDFARQAEAIRAGVNIIVATPGRLIDQMKVLDIDFSNIDFLVLDEADRMLDMGFLPDVTHIIDKLPKERQNLLFSATMPPQIQKLAEDIMTEPELVEIEISKPAESVEQQAYLIDGREKLKLTQSLLDSMEWTSCIIFTATKRGTDQLERLLTKKGLKVASIHGDREQDERTNALNEFKNGVVPIMVATDVLARGIDIDDVSLIINYDVPRAVEDYIHRIGRTGRYDKTGIAITLVSKQDSKFFSAIRSKVGNDLVIHKGTESIKKTDSKKPNKENTKATSKKGESVKITPDYSKAKKVSFKTDGNGKISINIIGKEAPAPKKKQTEKPHTNKQQKQQPKKAAQNKKKPKNNKKKEPKKPPIEIKTLDQASSRNKNARKPEKGFWGLIKSFFPKRG